MDDLGLRCCRMKEERIAALEAERDEALADAHKQNTALGQRVKQVDQLREEHMRLVAEKERLRAALVRRIESCEHCDLGVVRVAKVGSPDWADAVAAQSHCQNGCTSDVALLGRAALDGRKPAEFTATIDEAAQINPEHSCGHRCHHALAGRKP